MKVKITTIGAVLVLGILLFFAAYGYSLWPSTKESVREGFVDRSPVNTLGISISTCPVKSVSFVNENGDSICCEGTVSGGKCVGRELCSLSAKGSGYPTCSEWYASYLQDKGQGRCPATMPNYFEASESNKGCTDGQLNTKGTAPANARARQCKLYATMADANEKLDSCANVKYLDEAVCFPGSTVQARKSFVPTEKGKPPVVQCSMVDPTTKMPITCTTNESYARYKDATGDRNWKDKINKAKNQLDKLTFCSVAKKYTLDKSKTMKDLVKEIVFP
jgi:hypothetical protein